MAASKMTYTAKQYDSICNDYMHLLRDYEELKYQYTKLNQNHEQLVWKHRGMKVCHANLVLSYDNLDAELDSTLDECAAAITENHALQAKLAEIRKKRFDSSTAFLQEKARADYLEAANSKLKTTLNSLQSSSAAPVPAVVTDPVEEPRSRSRSRAETDRAESFFTEALDKLNVGDKIRRCWKFQGIEFVFDGRIARDENDHSYIVYDGKRFNTLELWARAIQRRLIKRGDIRDFMQENYGSDFVVVPPRGLKYAISILT